MGNKSPGDPPDAKIVALHLGRQVPGRIHRPRTRGTRRWDSWKIFQEYRRVALYKYVYINIHIYYTYYVYYVYIHIIYIYMCF